MTNPFDRSGSPPERQLRGDLEWITRKATARLRVMRHDLAAELAIEIWGARTQGPCAS